MLKNEPTLNDIRQASARIRPHAHWTPVLRCHSLDEMAGATLFFKCENFQKVGAFKFRGACNAVLSLTDKEASRGVSTHSSGNHAQALALAAQMRGIPATIVMPSNAPEVKKAAVAGYGGEIVLCEPTLAAREETLARVVEKSGAVVIHPYNNYDVIAGQGTAALEFLEDIPDLDAILVPVGGGGLLSGTLIAAKGIKPSIQVIAAEPEGADDAFRSWKAGGIIPMVGPKTVADGLLTSLGDKTFPVIQRLVDEIVTVSDEATLKAMRLIWERAKLVVEPSGAVPLGMLLEQKVDLCGKKIGIILSGGNVDLSRFFANH
jgi:threonine dehydratase